MKPGEKVAGRVVSVNISRETGTSKTPASFITIDETGVAGDAHAGHWHRQVSLLAQESINRFSSEYGRAFKPGEFAENITTSGLELPRASVLDRFVVGEDAVELELTQVGKNCHTDGCAIFKQFGRCVMPREGVFCRVLRGGVVRAGDTITQIPQVLQIRIITLSDRANGGIYQDRSGPKIVELVESFFASKPWRVHTERVVLPDDPDLFRCEILSAVESGADMIFSTGGTGIGPRDIAPDVVLALADKVVPGIMEWIRFKYGVNKPAALLSRSVAAVMGRTLIYTVPGSMRAVREYLEEILKTVEHALLMIRAIDTH